MVKVTKVLGPLALVAGLIWWIWFLTARSLQDADSWSSIAAGVIALLGLGTSLFGHRRPTRQKRTIETGGVGHAGQVRLGDRNLPPSVRPDIEERTATVKGDVHGIVDLGDQHRL
jgi:hypothetical protein